MSSKTIQIRQDPSGRWQRRMRTYVLQGGPEGVEQQVTSPRFHIGSHKANDMVLVHPTVSRFHLEILAEPEGFRLRDLQSTNGTFIDGLQVREAYLPEQALLRLGEVSLNFASSGELADLAASEQEDFHGVIGRSPAMREVFAVLERAAPTDATVLIEGESGTGKEQVAQALHRASHRASGPFVVLDCAAVPRSLMESELFGHERGAFTGATARADGRFREAGGGTLFLDEIGELPLEMQPKLLRVLESKTVRRLGASSAPDSVDVRLVAATNRDLALEVNQGTFREDLYYRLAVVNINLPPLRRRPGDLRPLVRHFVQQVMPGEPNKAREVLRGISEENWRRLEGLRWPGNVRELSNFIERTLILSDGTIQTAFIPTGEEGAHAPPSEGAPGTDLDRPFTQYKGQVVADFERTYLLGQLARHDNNLSAAARASGLDRMNFKRLLKKYR